VPLFLNPKTKEKLSSFLTREPLFLFEPSPDKGIKPFIALEEKSFSFASIDRI
jgi:hypothetical protein